MAKQYTSTMDRCRRVFSAIGRAPNESLRFDESEREQFAGLCTVEGEFHPEMGRKFMEIWAAHEQRIKTPDVVQPQPVEGE